MLQLDYDGYGNGDQWDVRNRRHYFLYDFKDYMLGMELNLKRGSWLRNVVLEYLYTKYQSGPIYHDHTPGRDRKSTRLNSSHANISYAVFCLKKQALMRSLV